MGGREREGKADSERGQGDKKATHQNEGTSFPPRTLMRALHATSSPLSSKRRLGPGAIPLQAPERHGLGEASGFKNVLKRNYVGGEGVTHA